MDRQRQIADSKTILWQWQNLGVVRGAISPHTFSAMYFATPEN